MGNIPDRTIPATGRKLFEGPGLFPNTDAEPDENDVAVRAEREARAWLETQATTTSTALQQHLRDAHLIGVSIGWTRRLLLASNWVRTKSGDTHLWTRRQPDVVDLAEEAGQ
jgi:hypothetical protein